jgi:patatin-like phospholipase/acyl hydrolase
MEILALNGGGMRGALHVGALQKLSEFYDEKYLHNIFTKGIYGISIGAIIGSTVAFGFSTDELPEILNEISDIQKVFHAVSLSTVLTARDRKGMDDGSSLFVFLKEIFQRHNLDLHTLKIKDALVPLHIIASDITNIKAVRFSGETLVWDALRASFALPIVFTPHRIKEKTYVDGAIMCENISLAIPKKDRRNTMFLLCYTSDVSDYIFLLMNCRSIRGIRQIQDVYPDNTCLLTENETPLFFLKNIPETLKHLRDTGYMCMSNFLSSKFEFLVQVPK